MAMAKYEREATMVMSVVMTWKRRFEVGTFHDRRAKRPDERTIRAKVTHRVRWPASPTLWYSVGVAVMD